MPNMLRPRHGQWYAHLDKGGTFQVVAIDLDDGLIEIQTFDGDVEEFEREGWRELDIEAIVAPEDCSGPFDEIQPDEGELAELDPAARDWRIAVQDINNAPWSIGRARWSESGCALAMTCKT
jgi:hypothetical protein